MICKNCPEGRRLAAGTIYCVWYGMTIREDHECTGEGGRQHERYACDPGDDRQEARYYSTIQLPVGCDVAAELVALE